MQGIIVQGKGVYLFVEMVCAVQLLNPSSTLTHVLVTDQTQLVIIALWKNKVNLKKRCFFMLLSCI